MPLSREEELELQGLSAELPAKPVKEVNPYIGQGDVLGKLKNVSGEVVPVRGLSQQQGEEALLAATGTANFKLPGVDKAADYLMQKAVGLKKYIPGVGTEGIKEGLIGTKGMMAKQAGRGMERLGGQMEAEAAKIPAVAAKQGLSVADDALKALQTQGGYTPQEGALLLKKMGGKASQLSAEPALTGTEQLARRKLAGQMAREAGAYKINPSQAVKSKLLKTEQAVRSQALKQANPAFQAIDKSYAGLAALKDAATKKPDLLSDMTTKSLRYILAPSAVSYATGDPKAGAAAAMLASPAGMSSLARLLTKAPGAASKMLPVLGMPGRSPQQKPGLTPEEEAELNSLSE